jgi:hypothetical protein
VPTDVEQQKECQRQLDGGVAVAYREIHPRCGQPERVRFPITDEGTFREAFPCAEAVDFTKERVDVVSFWESYGDDVLSNMVVKAGRTLVLVLTPVHCGGIAPGHSWVLVVVPRDIPGISPVRCTIGRCPERSAPPA